MKGETVAIIQAKLYLYPEELEWLQNVVKKQRTIGSEKDRIKSEQMLDAITNLQKQIDGKEVLVNETY